MQRIVALVLLAAQLRGPLPVLRALVGLGAAAIGLHRSSFRILRKGAASSRQRPRGPASDTTDWWDYLANRAAVASGEAAHPDPLLGVRIRRVRRSPERDAVRRRAGMLGPFTIVGPVGLKLLVVLLGKREQVELALDGRPLVALQPAWVAPARAATVMLLTVRRDVLATFPERAVLSVRVDGAVARGLEVVVPHGDGTLLARAEARFPSVDKKGSLLPDDDEAVAHQRALARLYVEAAAFLRDELGKDLFLLYGSLLGPVREGRFLPWDDDFDVAYLSDHTDVDAVRAESIDVMRTLAAAGFTVGLNPVGRPFRLGGPDGLGHVRLDVRPVWEMDGAVWAAKHARLPLRRAHFAPCSSVTVDGATFAVPRDAEAFLAAYYGADWREPKPGHREPSHLTREQQTVFDRLRLTYPEVVAINAGAEGAEGRPVVHAYGTVSLYPLDVRARVMGV